MAQSARRDEEHEAERRTKEGLTKNEIMRVLKRSVARELYPYLTR